MDHKPFHSWIKEQELDKLPVPTICKLCFGNGWLIAREKHTDLIYTAVFKCYCPIGINNKNNIPQWGKAFEYKYSPIGRDKFDYLEKKIPS